MGEYSREKWYLESRDQWVSEYGEIPPPWVFYKDGHPLGIGWRMGAGESFLMTYWEWWEEVAMNEDEMIAYFKKYSPPSRWLGWVCEVIWNLDPFPEPEHNYSEYFARLKSEGFTGMENYEQDYNDPKWIELQ